MIKQQKENTRSFEPSTLICCDEAALNARVRLKLLRRNVLGQCNMQILVFYGRTLLSQFGPGERLKREKK